MRKFYDKWVGMWVPESSVESANAAAANASGNQADAMTFARKAIDAQGKVVYVAKTPMRDFIFDQLPSIQEQVGGGFGVLATNAQGNWIVHLSFEEWLVEVGLVLEELNDEDLGPQE
jgi:hypothetical protein